MGGCRGDSGAAGRSVVTRRLQRVLRSHDRSPGQTASEPSVSQMPATHHLGKLLISTCHLGPCVLNIFLYIDLLYHLTFFFSWVHSVSRSVRSDSLRPRGL